MANNGRRAAAGGGRRDADRSIAAFENRCAHRGALICLDDAGSGAKDFQCVYHAWRYDLRGNLRSVAFQRGVRGKGGMEPASGWRITARVSCVRPARMGSCSALFPVILYAQSYRSH
ncbi:MAG: Rieske 2Fe-2S domain-containing protein [Mycobacterium sp.]|nr:Rieske 2Fe-2S domain-containing protein [Mycobacterium sp.]